MERCVLTDYLLDKRFILHFLPHFTPSFNGYFIIKSKATRLIERHLATINIWKNNKLSFSSSYSSMTQICLDCHNPEGQTFLAPTEVKVRVYKSSLQNIWKNHIL